MFLKNLRLLYILTSLVPISAIISCSNTADLSLKEPPVRIKEISVEAIINYDGIVPNKNITFPKIDNSMIEKNLQDYVSRRLHQGKGWNIKVNDYNFNFRNGSISYQVLFSKPGFLPNKLKIDYPAGSFEVGLLKNLQIEGSDGFKILEDSQNNLWAMGANSPLYIFRKNSSQWEPTGNDSNITNGQDGIIFEDSNGNIWSAGSGTPLQVLKKGESKWKAAAHDSKIKDGYKAVIFEDSQNNLWTMSSEAQLQVLKKGTTQWKDAQHRDSRVKIKGASAFMFEDSEKNLWLLASGLKLQFLKKGSTIWANDEKASRINNARYGIILEDYQNNLWILANDYFLKVLKNGTKDTNEWTNVVGDDLKQIRKKRPGGFIYQDHAGNLWVMSYRHPLQVLKKGSNKWVSGNNDPEVANGFIFEDSFNNLWMMSNSNPLQVLKKGTSLWAQPGKGSVIQKDNNGVIFEDSQKNLFAIGDSKIQILFSGQKKKMWISQKLCLDLSEC